MHKSRDKLPYIFFALKTEKQKKELQAESNKINKQMYKILNMVQKVYPQDVYGLADKWTGISGKVKV